MSKFKILVDRYEYIVREPKPDDEWDSGDSAADITINGAVLSNDYFDTALPQEYDPSKPLYLLWADYDTGDSFGTYGNKFDAVDLFQDPDRAVKAREELLNSHSYTRDNGKVILYSKPWDGYFERLNHLHLDIIKVLP